MSLLVYPSFQILFCALPPIPPMSPPNTQINGLFFFYNYCYIWANINMNCLIHFYFLCAPGFRADHFVLGTQSGVRGLIHV